MKDFPYLAPHEEECHLHEFNFTNFIPKKLAKGEKKVEPPTPIILERDGDPLFVEIENHFELKDIFKQKDKLEWTIRFRVGVDMHALYVKYLKLVLCGDFTETNGKKT